MADPKIDDLKNGIAFLVTALVKAMDDEVPGASARFIQRLDDGAYRLKNEGAGMETIEVITWARAMITGFNLIEGQGDPFFAD